VAIGLFGAALATGFASASLWPGRVPGPLRAVRGAWRRAVQGLRVVHRAHVGDYVSWVLVGFAVLGAVLLLP
jgi:hypothetical protein